MSHVFTLFLTLHLNVSTISDFFGQYVSEREELYVFFERVAHAFVNCVVISNESGEWELIE